MMQRLLCERALPADQHNAASKTTHWHCCMLQHIVVQVFHGIQAMARHTRQWCGTSDVCGRPGALLLQLHLGGCCCWNA
jgi:hypothetical protein